MPAGLLCYLLITFADIWNQIRTNTVGPDLFDTLMTLIGLLKLFFGGDNSEKVSRR